jgi:hypothetical protein
MAFRLCYDGVVLLLDCSRCAASGYQGTERHPTLRLRRADFFAVFLLYTCGDGLSSSEDKRSRAIASRPVCASGCHSERPEELVLGLSGARPKDLPKEAKNLRFRVEQARFFVASAGSLLSFLRMTVYS